MSTQALTMRIPAPVQDIVSARRRQNDGATQLDRGVHNFPNDSSVPLTIDGVIREIGDLRIAIRQAFLVASPEYQLLFELTENGLRDCAKCLRELEARAAQHPYNKMLIKIDAAYDAAVRMTRAGLKA